MRSTSSAKPDDVTAGFDRLPRPLREQITLLTLDFARFDASLCGKGRFSRAVFRRLFLAEILPAHVERIVSVDSDMLIVRPGLSRLAEFDLGGRPLAAAYDMIFLMDFKGDDALVRQFKRSRRALGLALDTPYFNAGLMAIDRSAWRAEKLTERVATALRDEPKRFPFMEQDALNATLRGRFAPLSPRYNFMGDFFLLDLERNDRADRAAFRQRAEAVGVRRLARRSPFRRELPRLVRRLSLARVGRSAGGAGMAADPAAADARQARLRCAPVSIFGEGVIS